MSELTYRDLEHLQETPASKYTPAIRTLTEMIMSTDKESDRRELEMQLREILDKAYPLC